MVTSSKSGIGLLATRTTVQAASEKAERRSDAAKGAFTEKTRELSVGLHSLSIVQILARRFRLGFQNLLAKSVRANLPAYSRSLQYPGFRLLCAIAVIVTKSESSR
jgi:hypothetical protein